MSIDYSAARDWAAHVQALAMVESGGSPNVGYSDGGRARGLLGQHPCFFQEYYGNPAFPASVTDTWWEADIKAAAAFLEHWVPILQLDLAIQAFNLGVSAVKDGERNVDYLAKWAGFFQRIRGGH